MTSGGRGKPIAGYWYHDPVVVEILRALREFRRADAEMRRRTSVEMRMNVTDLRALQHVIAAENDGSKASPSDLSSQLKISTAATTKLVDRLTSLGHVVRSAHPTDRRSVVLTATAHAHHEMRERLAGMHHRMAEIAAAVPADCRRAVIDFLQTMAEAMAEETNAGAESGSIGPGADRRNA